MNRVAVMALLAGALGGSGALAQSDGAVSLGRFQDVWEAWSLKSEAGKTECRVTAVDPVCDGCQPWILFAYRDAVTITSESGYALPPDFVGAFSVDGGQSVPMTILDDRRGEVAGDAALGLLRSMAVGVTLNAWIGEDATDWSQSVPPLESGYSYPLSGFAEAFAEIARECAFDPAPVLGGETSGALE